MQSNFRKLFEQSCKATGKAKEELEVNLQNAVTFMRSQHMHKVGLALACAVASWSLDLLVQVLLDRYNPLHDLTTEERIKATARRVGLDMPVAGEEKDD